jgi:putative DNA primase/helicase
VNHFHKANQLLCERLEDVLAFLFPHGKRDGNNFITGDINGSEGRSFSVALAPDSKRGLYKDFATSEKASRNLSKLWKIARGIPDENHARFFQDLESFAGVSFGFNGSGTSLEFDWPNCLRDFDSSDARRLALHPKRQYKIETIQWLHEQGEIGLYRGRITFAMKDADSKVVGVHRWFEKEGELRFINSPTLLCIGDPATAGEVDCHESVWDVIAEIDRTGWHLEPGRLFLSSRGAGNAKLLKSRIPPQIEKVFVWEQRDTPDPKGPTPNERWQKAVALAAGVPVYIVRIPAPHKDLNDWTIAGATAQDIGLARQMAQPYQPPQKRGTSNEPVPDYKELPPTFPPPDDRPCYRMYPKPLTVQERLFRPGVYYHTVGGKGDESYPIDYWLCAPLAVSAKTANKEDSEYGRLLEFNSSNGGAKKWSMPMALLAGDGVELLERLYNEGLDISHPYRKKIGDYISSAQPIAFLHCATRTGWHSADTFVLPDCVIGNSNIWFQSNIRVAAYAQAGTFDGWRTLIAKRAIGNPFLLFGLSFSLCGPLLWGLNVPGSGIHYYGDSTTGKTTVLQAGASAWGNGEQYLRAWRATANGLEGVCVQHTDTLLVLDEIAEISAKDLDQVAYFAVNGRGKSRATRHGEAKPEMRWRVAILSSGEQSIAAKLFSGGISIKAGQQMRILDIPVSGKHGLFDDLHGFENGAAFSNAIRAAASEHYGHAGPLFVKAAIEKGNAALATQHASVLKELATGNSQEDRAAGQIFALAALAGELATQAGIVPWESGAAVQAARHIFSLWRKARSASSFGGEHAEILRMVSDFINAHGDARFSDINAPPNAMERPVFNRAGWWENVLGKDGGKTRIFLFTSGALKEATKGYEFSRVLQALDIAGAFFKKGRNAKSMSKRTPDGRTPRLYWITPKKLEQKFNF